MTEAKSQSSTVLGGIETEIQAYFFSKKENAPQGLPFTKLLTCKQI